ncbi:Na(+) H(+) exchange regulatory cofactor NHE-RF1 [Paramuricea clavata]|uniref:Na(+) H(+) exchange regulatory cofactor NHE-RF1 n=1 Tax=Paramuricea clavata TaxID=317549 RepID=A0A6S7H6L4_PARCT|nr:Na(+) H(+) exchange regulatory cofactor NHE-RF1 [Paramuricea clavata]
MNGDIAHSEPEPPSLPRKVTIHRAADGYGFNLHGEKGIHGQYISAIDDGSPAQRNDLRVGDRVIAVNNEDVEDLPHSKVVERIRAGGNQVTLLVVDEPCDQYYKQMGEKIPQDRFVTPTERPAEPAVEENHVSDDVAAGEAVETMGTDGADNVQNVELPPEPVVVETPKVDEEAAQEIENDDDGYEEVIPKTTTTESKPAEIPAESPPEIVQESKPPAEVASATTTTTTTTTTQFSNGSGTADPSSKLDMAAARPKPKRHDVKRATQNWKQKYDDFNKL